MMIAGGLYWVTALRKTLAWECVCVFITGEGDSQRTCVCLLPGRAKDVFLFDFIGINYAV